MSVENSGATLEPPEGWYEWYGRIVRDLSFSVERDIEAARLLSQLMSDRPCLMGEIGGIIRSASLVVVAGAYDTVGEEARILSGRISSHIVVISADTATTPLVEAGITPHVIVTDLDGDFTAIQESWARGAYIIAHAHGDNIERLNQLLPSLGERLEATCQVQPRGHIHNFGGFTDGDRSVFLAAALGARRIATIGMCPTCGIGRHSLATKTPTPEWLRKKRLKLHYAGELLSWLATQRRDIEFIDATSTAEPPPLGFRKADLSEILGGL